MEMSGLEQVFAFQLRTANIHMEREHQFHPKRKWRFDFAIPERMIAIEIEGGIWSNGRHNRGAGYSADCEKYNSATVLGWRVLRGTSDQINNLSLIDHLKTLLLME